jgi:hypothetical protein
VIWPTTAKLKPREPGVTGPFKAGMEEGTWERLIFGLDWILHKNLIAPYLRILIYVEIDIQQRAFPLVQSGFPFKIETCSSYAPITSSLSGLYG